MGIYDTTTLLDVMKVQKTGAVPFWLTLFGQQINFDTPTITWDKVFTDDRKLAPFVIPTVQGRPQRLDGYESVQFAPAYIKIKDVVSAEMHIPRQAGETLGSGSLSLEQRRDAVIATLLGSQKKRIENRWEWLAAKAIIDGKVTVSGEDYPSTLVDFRRHASLTSTLLTTARWSQVTGDPMNDLRLMRNNAYQQSGVRVTKQVFGGDAWDMFSARVDLKALMDRNYGGIDANVSRIRDGLSDTMEFMGYIQGSNGGGRIEAWVNTAKYIDPDTGSEAFYLPQKAVVGVSDSVQGVRCFGAIMDKSASYRPLSIFSKNWENEDPSVEYLLSQSAPLMVPREPNATWLLTVSD